MESVASRWHRPHFWQEDAKMQVMIDLAFVRGNLALVKKKLDDRGMDPAIVLGDFDELEQERRKSILAVELKRQIRNQLSERFGQAKQSKANAVDRAWVISLLEKDPIANFDGLQVPTYILNGSSDLSLETLSELIKDYKKQGEVLENVAKEYEEKIQSLI